MSLDDSILAPVYGHEQRNSVGIFMMKGQHWIVLRGPHDDFPGPGYISRSSYRSKLWYVLRAVADLTFIVIKFNIMN